jgi:group I intron endonuclease
MPDKTKILISTDSGGVYQITHLPSGRGYIGSTNNLFRRANEHVCRLRRQSHNSQYLQRVWNKHSENEFEIRPLLICEVKDLEFYETHCIKIFNSTFNHETSPVRLGSKRPPRSQEWRDNMSKAQKGKPKSPEHLAKIRAFNATRKGTKASVETKHKHSVALKQAWEEGRMKGTTGKRISFRFTDKIIKEIQIKRKNGARVKDLAKEYKTSASYMSCLVNKKI